MLFRGGSTSPEQWVNITGIYNLQTFQQKIYKLRGQKVMLDFDLSILYEVETKRLNEAVKLNRSRFPEDFMFRLSSKERNFIRSQIASAS